MTLSEIKQLLDDKKYRPLKQLGQNFLIDENICRHITSLLQSPIEAKVYEIGPGLGVLTKHLLNDGRHITAFELDIGYCKHLINYFPQDKLTLIHGDALDTLLQQPNPDAIIGNLPYNITTPLLLELGKFPELPHEIVITIQKEVGDRIVASHDTKDYGATTVFLQYLFDISLERILPPDVFYPQPKVHSAVLRLVRKPNYPSKKERQRFHAFVKQGFSQRRKKLKNTLSIPLDERPQHLTIDDWWQIYLKYGPTEL